VLKSSRYDGRSYLASVFFERTGTECAYFIDKERGYMSGSCAKVCTSVFTFSLTGPRGPSLPAPAAIQVDASFFILATVDGADVSLRLKTRSFHSLQIFHTTSKATVHTAFRGISGVVVMFLHHCSVVALCLHSVGFRSVNPIHCATIPQTQHV
jgi:hypothetical protein